MINVGWFKILRRKLAYLGFFNWNTNDKGDLITVWANACLTNCLKFLWKGCRLIVFNATSGTLQSPGFPDSYQNGINCTYRIDTPHGYEIIITIHQIDIEYDADCKFDALRLQERRNSTLNLLGEFSTAIMWLMRLFLKNWKFMQRYLFMIKSEKHVKETLRVSPLWSETH